MCLSKNDEATDKSQGHRGDQELNKFWTERPQKTTSWIPAATRIAAKVYRVFFFILCESQRNPTCRSNHGSRQGREGILPSLGGGEPPYIHRTGKPYDRI